MRMCDKAVVVQSAWCMTLLRAGIHVDDCLPPPLSLTPISKHMKMIFRHTILVCVTAPELFDDALGNPWLERENEVFAGVLNCRLQ